MKQMITISSWIVGCLLLFSCAPGMMKTGFVENYEEMRERQEDKSLPSFYYIKEGADLNKYSKVIIFDFYALTTEYNLKRLKPGVGDVSNVKTELADNLARYIQSNGAFKQCEHVSSDIAFDDMESIRNLEADAVLMGNIADFRTGRGRVSDQFEIKLIDVASGETVMVAIDNNTTNLQAVAMPLTFGRLLHLIRIGKGLEPMPTDRKSGSISGAF